MNKQEITEKLKSALIGELGLEDFKPEDLTDETVLFGGGLGLDSIDAVEIVVLLEKHFAVIIKDAEEAKHAFVNIGALIDFIQQHMNCPI